MGWWKADTAPAAEPSQAAPSSQRPPGHPSTTQSPDSASSCPVDPRARSVWLQQASKAAPSPELQALSPAKPSSQSHSQFTNRALSQERETSSIPRTPFSLSESPSPSSASTTSAPCNSEIETGASASGNWVYPSEAQFFRAILRKHDPAHLLPQDENTEKHPPTASTTKGRKRSSTSRASPTDELAGTIPSIIPIHNAVNERAWALVLGWEAPFTQSRTLGSRKRYIGHAGSIGVTATDESSQQKDGPSLLSFRGLGAPSASDPSSSSPSSSLGPSSASQSDDVAASPPSLLAEYTLLFNPLNTLSPKARFNAFMGYQLPFDRHDWVVQRDGGERVEYVIDFYQGKGKERAPGLGFYLDVRPKLNTWEGWRTRGWGWYEGVRRWREGDDED